MPYLNPSPLIIHLVLPVIGPMNGLIEYIAYSGPVIDPTYIECQSLIG